MEDRQCLECGKDFFGRTDKKFCSDYCRNTYNNRLNSGSNGLIKQVNKTLKQNHAILKRINSNGKKMIHRDKLLKEGFDFDFYTNTYTTKDQREYHFCYDQGYLVLDKGNVLLVRRDTEETASA